MRHGISLFPVLAPEEKSAADYFDESLRLVELAESLGYESGWITAPPDGIWDLAAEVMIGKSGVRATDLSSSHQFPRS